MGFRKTELGDNEIQLVEQHIIKSTDPRFAEIEAAAFASKNLWNAANYILRQAFIPKTGLLTGKSCIGGHCSLPCTGQRFYRPLCKENRPLLRFAYCFSYCII